MDVIFLGGFFPEHYTSRILKKSNFQVQNAANTFQWAFINGLNHALKRRFSLITAPYIGWYPKYYKEISLRSSAFYPDNINAKGVMVGFCNLPLIKNYFKYINLSTHIKEMIAKDSKTAIIVYSLDTPYLKAAIDAKRNNRNLKVCVIVPDLHETTCGATKLYRLYLDYFEKPTFYKLLHKIDAFIVLTDSMVEYLKIQHKSWVRIEGLYQIDKENTIQQSKTNDYLKNILYTGTLDSQYGIIELLDAFKMLSCESYRLWICGGGNCIELVKKSAREDSRIKYFGIVGKEKVKELQAKATLLINPRNATGLFNKYSFPSKTMEYFASGTPTLMYKLDGVPDEYYEYCYTITDNNIDSMSKAIEHVCKLETEELESKGRSARDFIINRKNSYVQCKKVINMIETLWS